MTSDQHCSGSTPRSSYPTSSSAPSSAPGPKFMIDPALARPPFPMFRRDERGEVDIETLTRSWVGWRRLECGGADMGGVHTVEAGYARGAMFRPGGGRCRVELDDRAGRHWPPFERQHHVIAKGVERLEAAGLF